MAFALYTCYKFVMTTKRKETSKLRPVWIYLFIAFLSGIVWEVTFTMSAIYRVNVVRLDVLELVLLGTALELSVFLFEIPTGVVADLYSRRMSVIIGTFLMGFGFILEGALPIFATVLLAQVVWGLGWTFISGAEQAWITDEVGVEQAGKLFLRGRQFLQVGTLIGIILAVPLARISLQLPYFVGGGLNLFLGLVLIFFMPENGFQPKPKEEREGFGDFIKTIRSGVTAIRTRTTLVWFSLIALLVGLYSEGWDRLKEPHLLTNHTFPDLFGLSLGPVEWFAILGGSGSLLVIIASQIARRGMGNGNPRRLAVILQGLYAMMVVSMIGFTLSGQFWAAISFMLIFDTLRGITFPLSQAFVNHYVESRIRATVLSMTEQIDAFGQVAGGPVVGMVGRLVSMPAAILTSAVILFPAVPLFSKLLKADKRESQAQEAV
jgi:DHA3 family tetracycline resistance protein-like MFS transporter